MSRIALLIALLALCAAAASIWMFRGARSSMNQMEQKVEAAVQGQKSDLEKWASRLQQGRGIPIPSRHPRNLSGVHRLEWTDRSLDLWGWDEKRCRDEEGEEQGGACRFAVSDLARSAAPGSENRRQPSQTGAYRLIPRFENELERIGGEVASGLCRSDHGAAACEIGVELELPTLQGVGELIGRLVKWPFVLSGLRWENGKLSLRGYFVGGAS